VLAQLVQDLFHLERGEDGLDQHGGLDRAARQAQLVLGAHEDVVPQARLEMALHLGQVEERAGAARDLLLAVVEQEQAEVEDAARDALAVDQHMLLVQVPAARAHLQGGDLVVELVGLAVLLQRQRAADRLAEVDLALDLVLPLRGVAVLEVGHVAVGARVERVDDHLGLDRARDLDAAAGQRGRQRRDLPVALANGARRLEEVGPLARVQARGARDARGQQFLAARLERAVQVGDEGQRLRREDGLEAGLDRAGDGHALGQREAHGRLLEVGIDDGLEVGGERVAVVWPGRSAGG